MDQLFYKHLYHWYDLNRRNLPWRETDNGYYIWLSEVILQQTRVSQGLTYYQTFIETYPTVEDLAASSEDAILRIWQGLGYYSRARNMHKAAKMIVDTCTDSSTQHVAFPNTFSALRALPGVGDYTAGAIASFAYNQPYPALDGNVYRVLARLYDCDIAFDTTAGKKYFHQLAEHLLDRQQPKLFNSAIMEFGALHCLPTAPYCSQCPVQPFCKAYSAHTVDLLPVRKPRPTLRERYFIYTIYLTPARTTLIHQRTDKDIWQHLYEFPLIELNTQEEWRTYQQTTMQSHTAIKALQPITHVLSHQRLHAWFCIIPTNELPTLPDTIAVTWEALDDYALARLTLKALEQVNLL